MKRLFCFTVLFTTYFFAFSCSDSPKVPTKPTPEWVAAPTRTVDNGYIVYVGSGEDSDGDRAQFKAEAVALADLANECTFVPKGTRLEDRYAKSEDRLHEAYAKVGVEFQLCETAKKTVDPEEIKRQASLPMMEQIKKYQDMLNEKTNLDEVVAANNAGNSDDDEDEEVPRLPSQPVIHDDFHFFVVRQQLAYEKQTIILAPPGVASPPPSPQIVSQTQQISSYEKTHPELKKTPLAWSSHRDKVRSLTRKMDNKKYPSMPQMGEGKKRQEGRPKRQGKGHGGGKWNKKGGMPKDPEESH